MSSATSLEINGKTHAICCNQSVIESLLPKGGLGNVPKAFLRNPSVKGEKVCGLEGYPPFSDGFRKKDLEPFLKRVP